MLQVSQLLQLQKQSSDGVIEFDGQRFTQYVEGKRRPYTLFIFLSASHLQDKANLRLTDLRAEFGHTARAFRTHNANSTWTGECSQCSSVSAARPGRGDTYHMLCVPQGSSSLST